MGVWRSAPVLACVSLCVVERAEAAPPPPPTHDVNVVNTSVPVTVQNPDLDVIITNTPDVSITNTPNVSITNTPEVIVQDERFEWATGVFAELNSNSTEMTWCTYNLPGGVMEAVPAGYRFDIHTVNGLVFIPTGHKTALRVSVLYDSFDGPRVHDLYLPSHLLPAFQGRDQWMTHEAVTVRDATGVCVNLQYESYSPAGGNAGISLEVIGSLVPE